MCSGCPELTVAQKNALALDEALVPVARGLGLLELATGIALDRLFRGDLLAQLGPAREADYARERLGVPPSTMFQWLRLARELKHRPLLRAAVSAGRVSTRKALAVLPLAVGDFEAAWTEAAMRITLREIESAVKAAGKEDPEERFECESIVLPMTEGQQARLDAALALAKRQIGPEARRWQCVEAICQEWFSEHAEWDGDSGKGPAPPPPDPRQAKLLEKQLAAIGEAIDLVKEIGEEPADGDAVGLHARVLRLLAARRRHDETFGILALRAREARVHAALGYRSFGEYCEERLGMRAATVRQRIWLERRMQDLPSLREALKSGKLTYSKALAVARHATPFDIDDRIARAASTTCQQTEKEGEEEQDRKNRGAGVRELWAPKDAAETVREAIASAQAWSLGEKGVEIDESEALAVIADHFVEVFWAHMLPAERDHIDRRRHTVLMRKAGLCAVPGCSRAACQLHHIVYRSRGGTDDPTNLVGLCAVHHLHGVHLGYLEVTGRAGERLHWKLGTGEAVPLEEWVTFGDDDVRRAGASARASPGGGAGATDVESDGASFVSERLAVYGATKVESGGAHITDDERKEVAEAA